MFSSRSTIRVGHTHKGSQLSKGKTRQSVTAASIGGMGGRGGFSAGGGAGERFYISGIDVSTPYIEDIDHRTLCAMYKDIYLHDPVPGAAVDLMSNMPFSSFKIQANVGKGGDKIEEAFNSMLTQLKMEANSPSMAREHMVFGLHDSILIFKAADKTFTDTLPIPVEDLEIVPSILAGHDPILRVARSEKLSNFFADPSQTVKGIIERLNPQLVSMLKTGNFEIDPLINIYYPRKTWASSGLGESYYRRILPLYMLEKVLFRGTLTLANRRQSSILHITGGSDEWDITEDELMSIVRGFQNADKDPIGAVVGTRNEVNVNEVRQGGDFWKHTDLAPELDARKLLSLGINESFLSGDMNYNNMEHALSVFMENLRAMRQDFCNVVYYNKLFPLFSIINNFTKAEYGESKAETAATTRRMESTGLETKMMQTGDYVIPYLEYNKKLGPEGDADLLDMLEKLEEKGLPLSLRSWAVAGGLDIDELLKQQEASIEDEVKIAQIKKMRTEKLGKDAGNSDADSNEDDSGFASLGNLKPINILNRKFPESAFELYTKSATGKKHYANQERINRRMNRMVAATLSRKVEEDSGKKTYRMSSKKKNVEW